MEDGLDFSKLKVIKNPIYKKITSPVDIRLGDETIAYFTKLADAEGMTLKSYIELFLRNGAHNKRKVDIK